MTLVAALRAMLKAMDVATQFVVRNVAEVENNPTLAKLPAILRALLRAFILVFASEDRKQRVLE